MSSSDKVRVAFKKIPSVDTILEYFKDKLNAVPHAVYIITIRSVLDTVRWKIKNGSQISNIPEFTYNKVRIALQSVSEINLKRVINGTGIILHTGLGRAPISKKLVDRAMKQILHYSNLELDLSSGKRGERNSHVEFLLTSLTGSEASLVVNNNAAAVLLMLNALAEGKEVIISRGEQVEIGGSFRIPDVIRKSGCVMIEVGTTNKTHLKDYEKAITTNTGAILVAHTSNYKVMGFTESVEMAELTALAKKKKIPLILDLGCGVIADFKKMNMPNAPTVLSYIKSGAGVVSFSGDKLLGGPQAGIICGKKKLIQKIHKNPLYRVLRSDKLSYAILEATLRTYLTPTKIQDENLSFFLFNRSEDDLIKIANTLVNKLSSNLVKQYEIKVKKTEVEAGSGSLPLEKLKSVALQFNGKIKTSELSRKLRTAENPVLGYIKGKKFYIDLKAVPPSKEKVLLTTLNSVL